MLLGVVADDLTGATDVALMLSREGMRTVQVIGPPSGAIDLKGADAVVVALKSRTIPPAEAVALSLAAASALKRGGAEQLLFKYCSTFDSTDAGNIGPVAEALLDFMRSDLTIACPAFPANRTHHLPRPSLRRRPPAFRQPDEGPSAHPHARRQSRPRAAAASEGTGRARIRADGGERRGGDPRGLCASAPRGAALSHRRRARRLPICERSARPAPTCR